MAKSNQNPATAASRHATDPVSDLPPGGIALPRDPCLSAAAQMEEVLTAHCKEKYNTMAPGCCCKLEKDEHDLVHIHSNADVALLNTASNGSGGILGGGNPDSLWQTGPSLSGPWNSAFVVNSKPGTWGPSTPVSNAEWISHVPAAHFDGNTSTYYQVRFVLCEDIDPSKFELQIALLADNQLGNTSANDEIWVNGVVQSGISSVGYTGKPVIITLKNNWKHCVNEIIIHVRNTDGPKDTNWTGLFAQFSTQSIPRPQPCDRCECLPAPVPVLKPSFCVKWGDSDCDCFETNDCEVVCITACNCYSNVTFEDLTLGLIEVLDEFGNPVPLLPDGMPSVEVISYGPVCFGDLGPCNPNHSSCKSRQIVIKTCGAKPGKYQLHFGSICYKVCYGDSTEACFEFNLCKD